MIPPTLLQPSRAFFSLLFGASRSPRELVQAAIATGCGIGLFPKIPGTAASAVALLIVLVPLDYVNLTLALAATSAWLLGLWSVPSAERRAGDDAPCIVIDEFLGMWIALLTPVVPRSAVWIASTFVLFRVFDIAKIYPANILNARHGAFFVMADDIIAGFYALLTVHGLWLIGQLFDFRNML